MSHIFVPSEARNMILVSTGMFWGSRNTFMMVMIRFDGWNCKKIQDGFQNGCQTWMWLLSSTALYYNLWIRCMLLTCFCDCPIQYQQNEPLITAIGQILYNVGENMLGLPHRVNRKPSMSQNTIWAISLFIEQLGRWFWCLLACFEGQWAHLWWFWLGLMVRNAGKSKMASKMAAKTWN